MSVRGIQALVLAAGLAAACAGCRSLAGEDKTAGRSDLTAGVPSRQDAGRFYDPDVRQATAIEPVSPGPTPEETLAAATGNSRARIRPDKKKEEDSPYDPATWVTGAYKSVKSWAGYGPSEEAARKAFEEGKGLFRERRYEEAAKSFAVAADRWPESALEEDSLFLLGESHFFADRYPSAHEAYESLLKKYEFSRHVDRAAAREFAVGRYWEQLDKVDSQWTIVPNLTDKTRPLFDTWGNALKAYEHVRMNDPGGPLADDAVMATANANFLRGRFEESSRFYDMLRKDYPKSEHQLRAHLLALEAKQHVYQGPIYDGTPLKEAAEVADQTLLRFGPALGPERDRVIDTKNRLVEEMAARDWATARYYDKNAYYGAARIYYQSVIDQYSQTQTAEAARRRLEEIKDLPAEPPNHFKWLTYVFESKKRRR
jgi:outer membrane protein assembly factor BamD (BamD/ComL family)